MSLEYVGTVLSWWKLNVVKNNAMEKSEMVKKQNKGKLGDFIR